MDISVKQEREFVCNLVDAGCDIDVAQKCVCLLKEDKLKEVFCTLAQYRKSQLDTVHICQKRIDCLDYFIYTIKKLRGQKDK